ncbi:hypothetical protein O7606_10105 [Micromonospora sp. WMMD882]|uniref:hypothetical protein n=1 Tax=Micromonospora sp. WMMD882 TaxID=3015151 RepID=UPI00248C0892|nr:hypothetical protein [Micromonospora sp. WMMD882]WBB81681.1 hypothetical protein O7606_10105 [Micromonospora sp. WMMD882]
MSATPSDAVHGELLARQIDTWLTGALRRSRRATIALAYADAGPAGGSAETALRSIGAVADRVRGHRLTVVVLGGGPDLPTRLGPVEAALPADVAVHVVPGDPGRLPVVLKAAGAAGAPLLAALYVPTAPAPAAPPPPAGPGTSTGPVASSASAGSAAPAGPGAGGLVGSVARAVVAAGRPADLLVAAGAGVRAELSAAGFPLVAEVAMVSAGDPAPRSFALATGSDRNLDAFKESLWQVGAAAGLRRRDADGQPGELAAEPDPAPLAALLHAELVRTGPRPVTELRRHTVSATDYRATDALRALAVLLESGAARREPAVGRLAGDVVIEAASAGDVR